MRSVFFYRSQRLLPSEVRGWRWWVAVWTPVLVAVAVICTESTSTFSAQHTSGWLRPIVERWFGVFQDNTWDLFHHYLRKSGHFVGYGMVGLSFLRAWLHTLAERTFSTLFSWRIESAVLAFFSTAIVASCDEFHQTFVPGRTGTPIDVLLDSAGALAIFLLVWIFCWSKRTSERGSQLIS